MASKKMTPMEKLVKRHRTRLGNLTKKREGIREEFSEILGKLDEEISGIEEILSKLT